MHDIRILVPVVGKGLLSDHLKSISNGHVQVSIASIKRGPASIESLWEEVACVEGLVECGVAAERDGIGGIVVDCMGDPGVDVLREILSIPVFGPAQTSMGLAAMLGRNFSVLTVLDRSRPLVDDQVRKYGLDSRYAGCEVIDIPVLEFSSNPDATLNELKRAALSAVEQRKADVVLLGCTGWTGLGPEIQGYLRNKGHHVPVIDPLPATIRVLAGLLDEKLCHSKAAYPFPKLATR